MAELCPTGHEDSPFFLFLFMQRLPKELRVILGKVDDHEDVRAMANKADKLWSLHNYQHQGLVASVDPVSSTAQPPAIIAAVKTGPAARGGCSGGQRGKSHGHGGVSAAAAAKPASTASPSVTPNSMARASSSLCYFHWRYGDSTTRCEGVCSWQGNLPPGGTSTPLPLVIWSTCWIRYPEGVSLSTPVRATAFSRTGHRRCPLVSCLLAPQEQQFPVGVKKNLSYHLTTKNSNGLFF
jgi:hypothetical protein